jgi:hypothetical protein
MKEIHASLVESDAKVLMEVRMKLAGRVEAYLVEHAPKIHDSADSFVGAAGIFHQRKDG